jgi:hypothetical protein
MQLVAAASFPSAYAAAEPDEFHGPPPHPGYPDAFELGYVLFDILSPNKQYGVIYPNRLMVGSEEEAKPDFVVDVKNSRILASLETDVPYFEGRKGDFSVNWSPDSRTVLVDNWGKWFPLNLVLIELKDGKVFRQTQLLDQLKKMFIPAIAKHDRPRARMEEGLRELRVTGVKWKTGKGLQLEIKCEGGTNPTDVEGKSSWSGELTAIWDVTQRKFTEHKVGHTSYRPAGREEQ